jgi:hypothetical protein
LLLSLLKTIPFFLPIIFLLGKENRTIEKRLSEFLSNYDFPTHNGLNQKGCKTSPNGKLVLTTSRWSTPLMGFGNRKWITTLGDKFVTPFEDCAFSPEGTMVIW